MEQTVGGTGEPYQWSAQVMAVLLPQVLQPLWSRRKDMFIVKFDASGNTCGNTTSPSSISGTSGTAYPAFTVTIQNPTVTTPTPTIGSGEYLRPFAPSPPFRQTCYHHPTIHLISYQYQFIWFQVNWCADIQLRVSQIRCSQT
jgi:hypothetical protein